MSFQMPVPLLSVIRPSIFRCMRIVILDLCVLFFLYSFWACLWWIYWCWSLFFLYLQNFCNSFGNTDQFNIFCLNKTFSELSSTVWVRMGNGTIRELGMSLSTIWRSVLFLAWRLSISAMSTPLKLICFGCCLNFLYFFLPNGTINVTQRSEELALFVFGEVDHETLLLHRISASDIYRKQEGTLFF